MKRAKSVIGLSIQALKVKWQAASKLTRVGVVALLIVGGVTAMTTARCALGSSACGACPYSSAR